MDNAGKTRTKVVDDLRESTKESPFKRGYDGFIMTIQMVAILGSIGLGGAILMGVLSLIIATMLTIVYGQTQLVQVIPYIGVLGGFIGAIFYAIFD